jgi:hypothetical protein
MAGNLPANLDYAQNAPVAIQLQDPAFVPLAKVQILAVIAQV